MRLTVNNKTHEIDVDPETPLLWVLRDTLGMTGTKYGCGLAQCGACTVHMDGMQIRSCSHPVAEVTGKSVRTIEAMADDHIGRIVQAEWVKHDVAQCGYCQSGQIMSAVALLTAKPRPSDADIEAAMSGNLCRCGTYGRIRAAIKDAAAKLG